MGIVSSGVKKLTRGAVKKTAKKTAAKARPKYKPSPTDIAFTAGVAVPGLGLTGLANLQARNNQDQSIAAAKRAKEARSRLATGAKKFGPRGRR